MPIIVSIYQKCRTYANCRWPKSAGKRIDAVRMRPSAAYLPRFLPGNGAFLSLFSSGRSGMFFPVGPGGARQPVHRPAGAEPQEGIIAMRNTTMNYDPNVMGWDDVLKDDGQEYIILPEGEYDFTVTGVEHGQYPIGPRIPSCPKVTVTLAVESEAGTAFVRTDLLLYRTVEWKISAFVRNIGRKKPGEKAVMSWGGIAGCRGRARKPSEELLYLKSTPGTVLRLPFEC